MKIVVAALAVILPGYACMCIPSANPCSVGGETLVFVGRVIVDSGEHFGVRPAKVMVEERLKNVPEVWTEVLVDSSAGGSCHYRLRAGERYVVFASRSAAGRAELQTNACASNFEVSGNEHRLEALRNQFHGGSPQLVGNVLKSTGRYSHERGIEGAVVTAISEKRKYQVVAGAQGAFIMRDLEPGRYLMEVSKPGFAADEEFNRRWTGRLILNKQAHTIVPDDSEPRGSITLTAGSCYMWDLALFADGGISGVVTDTKGTPLAGVEVQGFLLDEKNKMESFPMKVAKTDERGRYTLAPLPGGGFVVGVNAEPYRDDSVHRATYYSGSKPAGTPEVIRLAEGQKATANLELSPPRVEAQLRVKILNPDGTPHRGAYVSLNNMSGQERGHSREPSGADGTLILRAYVGESYLVEARDSSLRSGKPVEFRGKASVRVEVKEAEVTVVLREER